ncbi:alanine racemase [Pontibacillus litoralis]|uniref:Alanine racemase n=1 Tax=Pontibacillus litoralis JSM 072002 TaxID=1385512 RepID=A0A0A5G3B0_9BACI|nr:alanine racemase [Pontibacillus litoralis]KGX86504.1 alanine racemase [Pontibacillus litoralis JSM 072002]
MNKISYRDTWLEVSLSAIHQNVNAFLNHIQKECKLMAVVKADGYGNGAVRVAEAALEAGADYLAVAFADEAIELREAGVEADILLLGYTPEESMEAVIKHDITVTIFTNESLQAVIRVAERLGKKPRIHIKVNTGMNRLGVQSKEKLLQLATRAQQSEAVYLEGVFTHFADADNEDPSYTEKQFAKFKQMLHYLEAHHILIPIKHCANSAATIAFPSMHLDMVRVGVSIYGLYPATHLQDKIKLTPTMTLKTTIASIQLVSANEPISYGCSYYTKRNSTIATVPIGYADGISRQLSNKGHVTVNGQKVRIVGKVCMDQMMIDITDVSSEIGDEVVIYGDAEQGYMPIDLVAEQMGTIHYEVATLIGKRVPRHYTIEGKVVAGCGLLGSQHSFIYQ